MHDDLKKINFPFDLINKYTLYETKRWDLETKNKIVIKLHPKKYLKNIQNYLAGDPPVWSPKNLENKGMNHLEEIQTIPNIIYQPDFQTTINSREFSPVIRGY